MLMLLHVSHVVHVSEMQEPAITQAIYSFISWMTSVSSFCLTFT